MTLLRLGGITCLLLNKSGSLSFFKFLISSLWSSSPLLLPILPHPSFKSSSLSSKSSFWIWLIYLEATDPYFDDGRVLFSYFANSSNSSSLEACFFPPPLKNILKYEVDQPEIYLQIKLQINQTKLNRSSEFRHFLLWLCFNNLLFRDVNLF